jgi:hypothetical protein
MNMQKKSISRAICAAMLFAIVACTSTTGSPTAHTSPMTGANALEAVFTIRGSDQSASVRAITRASACPTIEWDAKTSQVMQVRAAAATVPARADSAQKDSKEAVFDALTCEAAWPAGARSARIAGRDVPAPRADIKRIVIVADTGCRMKASDNAFQACNDGKEWPWAQVAQSAAATKPDLVIHIGDIHYRESPCPADNAGCAGSPWGYGYDTWQADLFHPAKALLEAAPWVFVRGNHESCFRAGQGWFRFVDSQPFAAARSCNDPKLDADADFSSPYAVSISPLTQLVVFDSSKTSGKPYTAKDPAFAKYTANLMAVDAFTQQKPQSFFMSHHPLLSVAPGKGTDNIKPGGTAGLLSVFQASNPQRLLPVGVAVAMHGHMHYFEAISFKTAHPTSLIMGNSGSINEGDIPTRVPSNTEIYPGAIIADYAATAQYGFATLDRIGATANWLLTEHTASGKPVFRCVIDDGKSKCVKVD